MAKAISAAAAVAPGAVALGAARAPQRDRSAGDQGEPGGEREEAGEVIARRRRPRSRSTTASMPTVTPNGPMNRASRPRRVPLSRGYAQAASASSAAGISPLARWSVADVPGLGWRKLSSRRGARSARSRSARAPPRSGGCAPALGRGSEGQSQSCRPQSQRTASCRWGRQRPRVEVRAGGRCGRPHRPLISAPSSVRRPLFRPRLLGPALVRTL